VNWRELLIAVARGDRILEDVQPLLPEAAAEALTGLLARAAETPPATLRAQALGIEARGALMVAELARVATAFEAASIPMIVFKGPALSQQLYGNPGVRNFSDLDVIVDPARAHAGEELLRRLAYRETDPIGDAERKTNRRFAGETLFIDDASGVLVDFHWRFSHVQFPLRIAFAAAWHRRQSVVIDGHSFQTLGETDLAVITCSHAAKHLWHRLEFFAQIAALTRVVNDWPAVDALAVQAGACRQVGLSFLLARDLLGISIPPLPRCEAAAAAVLPRTREIVDRNLFAAERRMDATGRDLFLLLDARRDAFRSLVLAAVVPTQADWKGSNLPAALHWVLRPWRLMGSRLGRRG